MKIKKGKAGGQATKKPDAKKQTIIKKKKSVAEITTDDFFNQDFENMELDISDEEVDKHPKINKKNKKGSSQKKLQDHSHSSTDHVDEKHSGKKSVENISKKNISKVVSNVEKGNNKHKKVGKEKLDSKKVKSNGIKKEEDSDSGDSDLDEKKHKKALTNLKEIDPEFFQYLKTHDTKLLDFNVEDDDDDGGIDTDDDMKHIPDGDLEVASDDSDYEADGEKIVSSGGLTKVTLKLIKSWQEEIQKDNSSKTIKCVVEAFHAALETVSDSEQTTRYRVEGSAIFNEMVQLCLMFLPDAFRRFLKLGNETRFEAHKTKRFPKVKNILKSYLSDLIKVLDSISSSDIITVELKHLHQMLPYTQSFSSLRKPLLRVLLKYWSTGEEETVRVIAFLCIIKIATRQPAVLNGLLKTMYIKYVENSKFVSPTTLPGINFMRRSLTELYLLDSEFSYPNAFLYIRQLAIHLRNALTLKKKEHFQAVYNWQYINSLWFWSEVIPLSRKSSIMKNLVYPLVQIIIGVIKLIPTSQYYPLRFHCVKMLINISREAEVFIPSLPFIIQVLEDYDFNKRHKAVSMKPISLMCMLRVAKGQATENGYKDALIENVYELLLENASKDSCTACFPDLYVFAVIKLKEFLKKCNVANYCRKMKQLLDKIEEGRTFIANERSKETFSLADLSGIEAWEAKIKAAGTPVSRFYESWVKVHHAQKMKLLTQNDQSAADFKVPTIKKKPKRPHDSDEDSDLEIPVEVMDKKLKQQEKRKLEQQKLKKKQKRDKEAGDFELPVDGTDIVRDISSADWD